MFFNLGTQSQPNQGSSQENEALRKFRPSSHQLQQQVQAHSHPHQVSESNKLQLFLLSLQMIIEKDTSQFNFFYIL